MYDDLIDAALVQKIASCPFAGQEAALTASAELMKLVTATNEPFAVLEAIENGWISEDDAAARGWSNPGSWPTDPVEGRALRVRLGLSVPSIE